MGGTHLPASPGGRNNILPPLTSQDVGRLERRYSRVKVQGKQVIQLGEILLAQESPSHWPMAARIKQKNMTRPHAEGTEFIFHFYLVNVTLQNEINPQLSSMN